MIGIVVKQHMKDKVRKPDLKKYLRALKALVQKFGII